MAKIKRNVRRPQIKRSWLAASQARSQKTRTLARRVILAIIVLAGMVVVLAALFAIFNTPERVVNRKIEEIARDYYENYYYDRALETARIKSKSVEEVLTLYAEKGIPRMNLEQLLLFDGGRHQGASKDLKTYCNEKSTAAQIFPEAPYGRENYRLELNYACNF